MKTAQVCLKTARFRAGEFLLASGGKATIDGLTPATTVWIRIRTAGIRGVMGAWSDPARIIVV